MSSATPTAASPPQTRKRDTPNTTLVEVSVNMCCCGCRDRAAELEMAKHLEEIKTQAESRVAEVREQSLRTVAEERERLAKELTEAKDQVALQLGSEREALDGRVAAMEAMAEERIEAARQEVESRVAAGTRRALDETQASGQGGRDPEYATEPPRQFVSIRAPLTTIACAVWGCY